jgi:hypothetical protein
MRLGSEPGKPALPVQLPGPELAYKVQRPELLPGLLPERPSGHPAGQTGLRSEP